MANVFDQFDDGQANVFDQFDKTPKKPPQGLGKTLFDNIQQGFSFGLSEEMRAAIAATYAQQFGPEEYRTEPADDIKGAIAASKEQWGKLYEEALETQRGELAEQLEERPVAAIGGQVLGSIPGVAGFAKVAGPVAPAAAATRLGKIGQGILLGASGAGAYGFGMGEGGFGERVEAGAEAMPLGAVLGGGIPAAAGIAGAPSAIVRKKVAETLVPFTERGARPRAERRIQELAADPTRAAAELGEETIAELTPAQQTGEPSIMALERAIVEESPALSEEFAKRTEANIARLEQEARAIGDEPISEATQFIEQRRRMLFDALDERVGQAGQEAQRKLSELAPEMRMSQSSVVVREELDKALSSARAQETALWEAVPEAILSTEGSKEAYRTIVRATPKAQRDDIPTVAKRFLRSKKEELAEAEATGQETTKSFVFKAEESAAELQGLRSKLLEEGRIARSEGNFNKARIADDLADAVLDDLGAQAGNIKGPVGIQLREALDFSRQLNEKFRQGSVGRIMGLERTGAERIAPELTLERTLGAGGTRAGVGAAEITGAADTPQLREGLRQYILNQFQSTATREGVINPEAARRFIEGNADVLDNFPGLRRQIAEAAEAQDIAAKLATRQSLTRQTLTSQQKSYAANFLNSPLEREFEKIAGSRNPTAFAKELVRQVRKDTTGRALSGLKSGAVDYLMRKATSPSGMLSGAAMKKSLNDARIRPMVEQVLTSGEIGRLHRITNELVKIERSLGKLHPIHGVMHDMPGKIMDVMARTLAARAGARLGAGTSGASLLTAQYFSQNAKRTLMSLTNDRAKDLLTQAIKDPDLMKALLTETTTEAGRKLAAKRFNKWIAVEGGLGASLLEQLDEDQ